ncbi:site-specific integrase [Cupriavidus basilensis]
MGDRKAIAEAERLAKRKALDIQAGQIIAGSVGDLIDRFKTEVDPTHYLDQSKDGKAVRDGAYENLTRFFGKMAPAKLKTMHGYQFLDARAKSGAPIKANKELSQMSTICNYAVRWGLIEANPFVGMMLNKAEKDVRAISRRQVVRFYLWSLRQGQAYRTMGCAAMFTYLTGFRAAEVRPFHLSGLSDDGVRVIGAKRKKGEAVVVKVRDWSPRLRAVVERAKQTVADTAPKKAVVKSLYLFPNRKGQPYSKSGWGSVWQDAMWDWIASFDPKAAVALKEAREHAAARRRERWAVTGQTAPDYSITDHPEYFSALDIRPAAITTKLERRSADAYDFAAHANPATTHRHYDRRKVKRASATE